MKKKSKTLGNKYGLTSVNDNVKKVLGGEFFTPKKCFNYFTMRTSDNVKSVKPNYDISCRILSNGKS